MKQFAIISCTLALIISGAVAATRIPAMGPSGRTEGLVLPGKKVTDSLAARGAYLVAIMGCDDCHTPKVMGALGPQPDLSRRFMGHPASQPLPPIDTAALKRWVLFDMGQTATVGPWGISYAANISADETGMGNWTEAQFLTAIRKGKFKGLISSRMLLPPMPWQQYVKASDEDLKAIFAFLKSTKPVRNMVPAPVPPNQLAAMR